jgi:NAD(P)-dependent dehydrogenase (short-subunit alcohol dehydrogenase family)
VSRYTILITGASRGLGFELARFAADRGAHVIATAREPPRAQGLRHLAATTPNVRVAALDVTNEASVSRLACEISEPVDILVCNAGLMHTSGGFDDPGHGKAAWREVLMTNVVGPFLTIQAFVPHLARGEGKKIAIISSKRSSNYKELGGAYAYRASKAAVNNLGLNIAADLRPAGIAVGIYDPGWVRTDMGGADGPIPVEDSAAALLDRFESLSLATTGILEDFMGRPMAI